MSIASSNPINQDISMKEANPISDNQFFLQDIGCILHIWSFSGKNKSFSILKQVG